MITVFIITFIVMSLAAMGLAIGWLVTGRELKGSCGGLSNVPGVKCDICGRSESCEPQ